jgi:hypothetical protein
VLLAWRREEKGCGETFSLAVTDTLYSQRRGKRRGGSGSSSVAWRGGVGARRLHDVGAEEAGGGGCGVVARSGDKGGDGTLTRGTPA